MHLNESFICNNAAHDVFVFFIEFTWTFGDYFDMMIYFFEKKNAKNNNM